MASFPTKLLKAKPTAVSVTSYWTGQDNGYMNYPFKWSVVLEVSPQSHSSSGSQTPYFYNALDIKIGDWYSNGVGGAAWKISAVTNVTSTSVTCVFEDVDQNNTLSDPTQNGDGGPALNVDGFVFELGLDKMPILNPVILNTITAQWQTDLMGRFSSKIVPSTGNTGSTGIVGLDILSNGTSAGTTKATALDFVGSEVEVTPPSNGSSRYIIRVNAGLGGGVGEAPTGYRVQDSIGGQVDASSGSVTDVLIYSPTVPTYNVLVHSLQIRLATVGGGSYVYEVYRGVPSSNGRLIFSSAVSVPGVITETEHTTPRSILALASDGRTDLYLRVYQRAAGKIMFNVRVVCSEFAGRLEDLPGYVTPPPYTGPLKMAVYVGKDGEFEEPRYALSALNPDGGVMYVQDGMYYLPMACAKASTSTSDVRNHFHGGNINAENAGKFSYFTIEGESTYGVVFNGRGGYGPGGDDVPHPYRLAFRKGFIYSVCPYKVKKVNFIQCGAADLADDGEAALRSESFDEFSWIDVEHCAFDRNENGIFIANNNQGGNPGDKVRVRATECDFGLRASNGATGAGLTHDIYVNGDAMEVVRCNFYGTRGEYSYGAGDAGNCIKARSRKLLIDSSYVRHGNGRCFDRPEGGVTVIKNTTFAARDGAVSNLFGYNNESNPDNAPQGAYDVTFENCKIYASRYADAVWNDARGKTMDFTTTEVIWCKYRDTDNVPPSFSFVGAGDIVGLQQRPDEDQVFVRPPDAPGSIAQPGYSPVWP